MDQPALAAKIQDLNDIELALLLCIIAKQSCLLAVNGPDMVMPTSRELEEVSAKVFGLVCRAVHCESSKTPRDFSDAVLIDNDERRDSFDIDQHSMHSRSEPGPADGPRQSQAIAGDGAGNGARRRRVADLIVVTNLSMASEEVQIQVLELIRTRRLQTNTASCMAPEGLVVVVLESSPNVKQLVTHLVDHLFLSHYERFGNIAGTGDPGAISDLGSSFPSVLRQHGPTEQKSAWPEPVFSPEDILELAQRSRSATMQAEVRRYLQDIIVFLRLHRAVDGGVTARATRHFELLASCLAALHDSPFVTPSLVALAAKKVYWHRLVLTRPENERSMQWGSSFNGVEKHLSGIGPGDVIESVLGQVDVPL